MTETKTISNAKKDPKRENVCRKCVVTDPSEMPPVQNLLCTGGMFHLVDGPCLAKV